MNQHHRFDLAFVVGYFLAMLMPVHAAWALPVAPAVRVGCIGITVSDADKLATFYAETLGFSKNDDFESAGPNYEQLQGVFGAHARTIRMRLGDECLDLTEYLAPKGRPVPLDSRSQDLWFQHVAIVVSDMDRAFQTLRAHHVEFASSNPQTLPSWNKQAAGIRAFYFKDPDHHTLELIAFPGGKGDPKWQSPAKGRLFLGIDHTAIVVANTDRSLQLYRELLGLRVTGESENWGGEQEHLNNVFGAHLRITSLRANSGPGLELLEYLAPRDGRRAPEDARANDLTHWQTPVLMANLDAAVLAARAARFKLLSAAPVALSEPHRGGSRSILLCDEDGHTVELVRP